MIAANDLRSRTLVASDGELGSVKDVLFEDEGWAVRYLAVDTGGWLSGRQVILAPDVVEAIDDDHVVVALTRKQVEESPALDADAPISRRYERDLYGYYGFTPYWGAMAVPPPLPAALEPAHADPSLEGDPHLRSSVEVTGYHVRATDDEVGHVEDLLLTGDLRRIPALLVDTRNVLPGKKVILDARDVALISWQERMIFVGRSRASVEHSREMD